MLAVTLTLLTGLLVPNQDTVWVLCRGVIHDAHGAINRAPTPAGRASRRPPPVERIPPPECSNSVAAPPPARVPSRPYRACVGARLIAPVPLCSGGTIGGPGGCPHPGPLPRGEGVREVRPATPAAPPRFARRHVGMVRARSCRTAPRLQTHSVRGGAASRTDTPSAA